MIISSRTEWTIAKSILNPQGIDKTPYGECFVRQMTEINHPLTVHYMEGGLGKISSAGAAQFAISKWSPDLIVNLGTCGGFKGYIERGDIILVHKTVVYDIIDNMEAPDSGIDHYTTLIDLSWLNDVHLGPVLKTLIVSADHDLQPLDVKFLHSKFGAVAADWESGAIAWIARKNNIKILILRGVTDLVDTNGGDVYGNDEIYQSAAKIMIHTLSDRFDDFLRKHFNS